MVSSLASALWTVYLRMYAFTPFSNSDGWYDFGYLIGASLFLGETGANGAGAPWS